MRRLSREIPIQFQDDFLRAAVAPAGGSVLSFCCSSPLYGLSTLAASVSAARASGMRFRLSRAKPNRYWLRPYVTASGFKSGATPVNLLDAVTSTLLVS